MPCAFWNQRKKAAKLNSTHTSPTQPKPVDKAAENNCIIPANKANDNKKDNEKVATTEEPNSISTTTEVDKEAAVNEEKQQGNGAAQSIETATVDIPLQQQIQKEQHHQEPLDNSDEDMLGWEDAGDDSDNENIDLDMAEAKKEAAASSEPLEDVVKAMKRQEKLRRRKAKAKQMLNDK